MQARLHSTLEQLKSSQRRAVTTTRLKDVRAEVVPEVPHSVVHTIKRVVCGDAWSDYDTSREGLLMKVQPDKQTSYLTDELTQGARDLKPAERERIECVFREVARGSTSVDEKGKDFKWNQVSLPWADFVRHWRGKLPQAHINRLAVYFGFSKAKLRAATYVERVGLLLTCTPERRLKVVFSLLDINGDSVLGPRDVFAALSRRAAPDEPEQAPSEDDPSCKRIKAIFDNHGTLGLDFLDADTPFLEVAGVLPSSPADQLVHVGDVLVRVNEVRVEKLLPQEVKQMLLRQERPLSLVFVRHDRKKLRSGLIPQAVFQNLLQTMKFRERLSTRLKVTVMYARGLRNADGVNGGKSDPYCVCEVEKKPHVGFSTKVISNSLDPEWNEEHDVANYMAGDTLRFTVRDKDIGSKQDEQLGTISVPASKFLEKEFEQELTLTSTGGAKGTKSTLRLKIVCLGEGGIPFDEFAKMFSSHEDVPFFPALVEELTGHGPASLATAASRALSIRLKLTIISASGLRPADINGKSDPYCVAEIPGKSSSKVQTPYLQDTMDPVWNKRFEMDFTKGDTLKFSVYDRDPGSHLSHDCLGHVSLTSWQVLQGFDGEFELMEGGRGYTPKLRVKIQVPKAVQPATLANLAESPGHGRGAVEVDAALVLRREAELQDVQRMPQCQCDHGAWYLRSFEALCDHDFMLRRHAFEAAAMQLLGMPSTLLASRFFDVLDKDGAGELGLQTWVIQLDRFFGPSWERSQQRVALSFQVYDLDGDGVVTIGDAVALAGEVERLAGVLGHPPEGPSTPICEEMRLLYGKAAEGMDLTSGKGANVDAFMFKLLQPHPVMYNTLMEGLASIGRPRTPRATPTPTANVLDAVTGEWDTTQGDTTFQGLRFDPDGRFCLEGGKQEGFAKAVPGMERKFSVRRTKKRETHDYVFELDEDGLRLTGQCLRTRAEWIFTKAAAG